MWLSGRGGWFYWLVESAMLALVVLLGMDPPFNRVMLGALVVFGLAVGWYIQGSFWPYVCLVSLEMFLGLVCLLVFPLCESLVKESVDDALKTYAGKIKVAMKEEIAKR